MKQYTVTFVVRAVINLPEDVDDVEFPNPLDSPDDYNMVYASEPEILDIETITEHDSL
jgi:hypothetical protein